MMHEVVVDIRFRVPIAMVASLLKFQPEMSAEMTTIGLLGLFYSIPSVLDIFRDILGEFLRTELN